MATTMHPCRRLSSSSGLSASSWLLLLLLPLVAILPELCLAKPHGRGLHHSTDLLQSNKDLAQCSHLAEVDDCELYSCIDTALGCKISSLRHSLGHRICQQTTNHLMHFSPKGRLWALQTRTCMTETLQKSLDTLTDCSAAQAAVTHSLHHCTQDLDICPILWPDRLPLLEMFGIRSWLEIVQTARSCPRDDVNNFIFWAMEKLQLFR